MEMRLREAMQLVIERREQILFRGRIAFVGARNDPGNQINRAVVHVHYGRGTVDILTQATEEHRTTQPKTPQKNTSRRGSRTCRVLSSDSACM